MRLTPLILSISSLVASTLAETCVIQGKSIGKFDLNGLRKPKADYSGISNPDGGDVSINFCGTVVDDPIAGESSNSDFLAYLSRVGTDHE